MVLPPPSLDLPYQEGVHQNGYAAIPTNDDDSNILAEVPLIKPKTSLSLRAKWEIVSPLLTKYMLPLCTSINPILLVSQS
jgi:hypothetical protein